MELLSVVWGLQSDQGLNMMGRILRNSLLILWEFSDIVVFQWNLWPFVSVDLNK